MTDVSTAMNLIDTERYDLSYGELSAACFSQFRAEGICVLPGFLRPEAVASLVAESAGDGRDDARRPRLVTPTLCPLGPD